MTRLGLRAAAGCLALWAAAGTLVACERAPDPAATGSSTAPAATGASAPSATASTKPSEPSPSASVSAAASASFEHEPPLQSLDDQASLLALVTRPPSEDAKAVERREELLLRAIGPGSPGKMNQGNPKLARHSVSRAQCLAGLAEITLQTEEQRRICQGHELMVPIHSGGDPAAAKACIDVFEFPNRPCELPFVWASAGQARAVCKALGKRLCTQQEWVAACSADPAGGEPSKYAYGNELDLGACNTSKSSHLLDEKPCDPSTIGTAWKTCGTNTEPAGAFPRCRSRLGIFDQHGNVAEAMSRWDRDKERTMSQLKGSAFFYLDVAEKPGKPAKRETYPDHCAHDPRWHVQELARAWHVNYHLGFRCCLSVGEDKEEGTKKAGGRRN